MRGFIVTFLLLWAAGCDPSVFDDIKDNTPVIDIERPSALQYERFGARVHGYRFDIEGNSLSRLAMSSGPGSAIRINQGWTGEHLEITKRAIDVCLDDVTCDGAANQARSMVPLRQWDGESMCMAAVGSESSSMPNAGVVVVCESEPMRRASLKVPSSVGFGEASAELPPSVLSLGLALVGAPLMNSGDGGVYLLLDAKPPSPLILSDHSAVQGKQGALGTAVAAGAWDADSALVAMTAPKTRTLVLGLLKEGSATLEVHACLQGQSPWRPMAVTIGDINQEHTASDAPRPDLIVHVDSDGDGAADRIEIYDGKDVPPASGCNPWDGDPVLIDCPQGLSEELRCIDANFAASAAIGDINGDGVGDLLVGAPDAAIGGKLSSGAVVVFPGGARTTSGALRFGEPVLVAHPDPSTGAMLGSSVTTVSTGNGAARRDELVAGAPGIDDASGAVTVFLCTPLLGDLSSEQGLDARCVPEE